MLRTQLVLRLIRSNVRLHRPISTTTIDVSAKNVNKSRQNVDEMFNKDRRAIEPLIEDPIVVKKFFISEVDSEQMLYPEVISKDELDRIFQINDDVAEFMDKNVQFDDKGISQSTDEALKQKGMYGYNVPKEFGGYEHTCTETILAGEAESRKIDVAMVLNAHRLVCEAINEYGTGEQRAKYLPSLARGDLIATTAFHEWNRDDIAANQSTAIYDGDKRQWCLNGTKSFVVNAAKSNLFLITALVPQSSKTDSLSVFIVDGNLPGISVHKKDETVGFRDVYQASVSFKDVCLSEGIHFETFIQSNYLIELM